MFRYIQSFNGMVSPQHTFFGGVGVMHVDHLGSYYLILCLDEIELVLSNASLIN